MQNDSDLVTTHMVNNNNTTEFSPDPNTAVASEVADLNLWTMERMERYVAGALGRAEEPSSTASRRRPVGFGARPNYTSVAWLPRCHFGLQECVEAVGGHTGH